MPDDDAACDEVVSDGALAAAAPGTVNVNMATGSIAAAQRFVAQHALAGVEYEGAPVFGRADVAVTGKLNIVAGGSPAALTRLEPVFSAIGQKVWSVGPDSVRAHAVKIAGNFMIASWRSGVLLRMNPQPLRVVFLTTPAAKDWLRTALSPGNLDKTLAAPVVAIWAHDLAFPER